MTHCSVFKMQESMSPLPHAPLCILNALCLTLCCWVLSVYFAVSQHLPVSQHYLCCYDLLCHHWSSVTLAFYLPLISADICLLKFNFVAALHRASFQPLQVHSVRLCSVAKSYICPHWRSPPLFLSTNCHRSLTCHMSIGLCFLEISALLFLGVGGTPEQRAVRDCHVSSYSSQLTCTLGIDILQNVSVCICLSREDTGVTVKSVW